MTPDQQSMVWCDWAGCVERGEPVFCPKHRREVRAAFTVAPARCRVCGATAPATPDGILEGVAHAQAMENDPEHVRFLAADRRSNAIPASGRVRPRDYEECR